MKNRAIVSVTRTLALWPMCRHGTEYSTLPTRTWISGPIFALAQVAGTNGSAGNGLSASISAAANTVAGAVPSWSGHAGRWVSRGCTRSRADASAIPYREVIVLVVT